MANPNKELFKDRIEVNLDGRQIFYLFFGGSVIATLVFVLGVMVGRQVESRSVAEVSSTARDPLAALDRLEGDTNLAFPAALRGDEVSLGDVDKALEERTKLSKKRAPLVAAAKHAAEISKKEEKAKDKSGKAERAAAKKKAAEEEKAAEELKKLAKKKFTLQVGSFQDKSEADTFFRQLATTKYKPYMIEAEIPGKGQYYRVRVGGFGSFDEALAAKASFEDSQHVIAYVTRLK